MAHKIVNNSTANLYHVKQIVDEFFPYSNKRLGFDRPATIVFQSDDSNAKKMLGKTAFYDPDSFSVTVFVDNRHPKDILRSLSHELVHHAQNCRGEFKKSAKIETGPGYAQKDPFMRKMELEAYKMGNIIFRDFEDLIKTGKININIDFSKGETDMSLKEWKNNELFENLSRKFGFEAKNTLVEGGKGQMVPAHDCANHVRENTTGREGFVVDHNWDENLQEITEYDVDFGDEIVENIPISDLTVLELVLKEKHPGHSAKYRKDSEEKDLEEKKAVGGQEEIAKQAPPEDEITAADLAVLRKQKKVKKENKINEVDNLITSIDNILQGGV